MTFRLNHIHLKTKDPETTSKFYVDALGAKCGSRTTSGGLRLDLLGLPLNVSEFRKNQARKQKYGMEHIAIETDEFDVVVGNLRAQGVNIIELIAAPGVRRVCFFEGPDSVEKELMEMKA